MSEFEYLRSFVSLDGDAEAELSHGLRERGKMMRGLAGLWRSRKITFDVKSRMLEG